VAGRFERIATTASRALWEAAQLEQCEIADGSVEVIVLDEGSGPDAGPTLRVVPNGPECEAVEFVAGEGTGILLVIGPQGDRMD
jgi:hypothetical protein